MLNLRYVAGILDGEGYIGIHAVKPDATHKSLRHVVKVQVGNTHPRLIWLLKAKFGGGVHRRSYLHTSHPSWKPLWSWSVGGAKAERILKALRPHLVLKGPQASIALAMFKYNRESHDPIFTKVQKRELLRTAISTFNEKSVP